RPKINPAPLEALGERAAEEAVRLTGGSGSVVIIGYDAKLPTFLIPQQAFEAALEKHPGLRVAAVKALSHDPTSGFGMDMGPPADAFLQVLREHADATVVVSFSGVPYFTEPHYAQLPSPRPMLIVVLSGPMQLAPLFERDIIQAALVARFRPPDAATVKKDPQTPQEWFDRYYEVLTPENFRGYPG
ncbi:hypothetical protein HQ590_16865, partial [bacterium]|nr:hypothetical protein [bacterium]